MILETKQVILTLPLEKDNKDSGEITIAGEATLKNDFINFYELTLDYLLEENKGIRFTQSNFYKKSTNTETIDTFFNGGLDSAPKIYLYDSETIVDWSISNDKLLEGLITRYNQDPSTLYNPFHSCQREKNLVSPLFWEAYTKFNNEVQFAKVAKVAASWWADRLQESGSSGDLGIDSAYRYYKSQADLPKLTEDVISKFKWALEERILSRLIEKNRPDFFSNYTVSTDYDPDESLAIALEAAGIKKSSFNLPMKTVSWIRPTCFKVNKVYGSGEKIVFKEKLFDD